MVATLSHACMYVDYTLKGISLTNFGQRHLMQLIALNLLYAEYTGKIISNKFSGKRSLAI